MQDMEMKKKIAQEIMDLMDQKDGEKLKGHPKLIAASVEVGKKPLLGDDLWEAGEDPKEEKTETPDMETKEAGEEELSPEMIKKLIEMCSGS